jgi:hypothetical protein
VALKERQALKDRLGRQGLEQLVLRALQVLQALQAVLAVREAQALLEALGQREQMVVTRLMRRLLVLQEEKDIKAPLEPQEILEHLVRLAHLEQEVLVAHLAQLGFQQLAQGVQGVLVVWVEELSA